MSRLRTQLRSRHSVWAGLLLLAYAATPSPSWAQGAASDTEGNRPLTGEEVRELISGNTLKGGWRARPYEFDYKPDGTVYGTIWTSPDRGKWYIDGDKFCQRWVEFFGGDRRCYQWYRAGDRFLLKNVDSFRTRDITGTIVPGR